MKLLIKCLLAVLTLALSSAALAAPPAKIEILHCGCVIDADGIPGMAFIAASVSSKARGHAKHGVGTVDSCYDGVTFIDFERTANDCYKGDIPFAGLDPCTETHDADWSCGRPAE